MAAFNPITEQSEFIPSSDEPVRPEKTPSVVSVDPATGRILVGRLAKSNLPANPHNTITEIRREMGDVFQEDTLDKFHARGLFKPGSQDYEDDPVRATGNQLRKSGRLEDNL